MIITWLLHEFWMSATWVLCKCYMNVTGQTCSARGWGRRAVSGFYGNFTWILHVFLLPELSICVYYLSYPCVFITWVLHVCLLPEFYMCVYYLSCPCVSITWVLHLCLLPELSICVYYLSYPCVSITWVLHVWLLPEFSMCVYYLSSPYVSITWVIIVCILPELSMCVYYPSFPCVAVGASNQPRTNQQPKGFSRKVWHWSPVTCKWLVSDKASSYGAGQEQGKLGEFCAFQSETSSRKEGGAGTRRAAPEWHQLSRAPCRQGGSNTTSPPTRRRQDWHWSPEYLVFS